MNYFCPMYTLTELWIYPVKSLGGIPLAEANVEPRGLRYDRRWMLVDAAGRFVSQREIPEMALLGTNIEPPALTVFWKKKPSEKIRIPLDAPPGELEKIQVQVWNDQCAARVLPSDINDWFSDNLKQNLRLVFMPESTRRQVDTRYAPKGQYVRFPDGFPFLLIGQASLDELNSRLARALPMNRFRPNFVFAGGHPFEEDLWREFQISNFRFQCVKPCARCTIPTTDQETAIRSAEPLKTLATFRKAGHKILFGQNVVFLGTENGKVKVGDAIRLT